MVPVRKINQGQQTELVKKQLICYIMEENIPIGGKLPSQNQLRTLLKVGSKTIQRAMKTLEVEGIVELREKCGAFLLKTDAGGYRGRKIGLVSMRLPDNPLANALLQCIQHRLHDRGADCVVFLRNDAPMKAYDSLALFPGLERCITDRTVDALISTVPLDENVVELCRLYKIPLCYYGDRTCYENSVQVCNFCDDAIERLIAARCRRPAALLSSETLLEMVKENLLKSLEKCHGSNAERYVFCIKRNDNQSFSREEREKQTSGCVDELLALPEKERPDGIYIPDDFIAAGFVTRLLLRGEKLPQIITHRNLQIPLEMPFPMLGWYENDVMEIAGHIVGCTYELLLNNCEKQIRKIQLPFIPNNPKGETR